jgi:hypothetical protein
VRPSDFLADFFSASTGSVYLCSLPNERNGGRPAEICGRGGGDRLDELIVHEWDKPDRGAFFCVSTLKPKQARRSKETVFEIVTLHADLDWAKIVMEPDAILRQLQALEFPPSKIVHSGHGYHAYWLLSEALPATPGLIAQTEKALRGLANMLGGDLAVCEVARLMRVPGSYNTKNGDRIPVTITIDSTARYELDDLDQWIAETRPLIPRKGESKVADNPFLAVEVPGAGGPVVDVGGRLAAMRYRGSGDSSIHATKLAVSAAMLSRGTSVEEVISIVLAATRVAAGTEGARWNWQHEERDIRHMCETWARKKLNGPRSLKHAIDTLEDIMVKEFKPVEHFIPDLIPAEGVTLLVAKSKVGKSWLLYDACISAALGRELLGGRKPKQGHSLYLALEDSQKRLRFRGEKLLGFHVSCPGVALAITWDRVDQGGLQLIKDWVENTRAQGHTVVCICIDVLQMIRPLSGEKQSVYQRDYMALLGLRTLAAELGIAIIVAHHQRKSSADDLQDTISGTQGLPAAADCSIVLERQVNGGFILDVRGRDIEAQQLAATFDKETCRWHVGGDASEMRRSETRRVILEALRDAPEGMGPADISVETGIKPTTVRSALLRMRRDGEVKKVKSKYVLIVPSKEEGDGVSK